MGVRSQPEPADDVVTKTSPNGLQAGFEAASAAELPEAAAFLDPGVRELGDLRALCVDLFCFLRGHLQLERGRRRWFFEARDRSQPIWSRLLRRALIAQRAGGTGLLRCAIDVGANTVITMQERMVRERVSGGTGKSVLSGIVGKRAG
jgi:hypothetical protein